MKRFLAMIASAAQVLSLVAAFTVAPALSTPAAAQPCQWNYSFVANVATATYCGQVNSGIGPNTVSTVANLAALPAVLPGAIYTVLGYNTPGDGGGGTFLSVAGVSTGDSCVSFPGLGAIHWLRQLNGVPISVEDCGAYHDGTHATQTTTGIQAALNYVAASGQPNQTITMYGASYLISSTITKAQSVNCPNIEGAGFDSTIITYHPGSQSPAFKFIGGSGQLCRGGLSKVTIDGGANGVGCRWEGQTGSYCNISFQSGYTPFQWCNCGSGQFTEETIGTVEERNTNSVSVPLGEFIVSGGDASFRGSGIGDDTVVTISTDFSTNPMLTVPTSAYWYNAKFGGIYTNVSGALAKVIQNSSNNPVNISGGNLNLEGDSASAPFQLADLAHNPIYLSNNVGIHGQSSGNGFAASNLIYYKTFGIGANGVVITTGASVGPISASFVGSAGVTFAPPLGTAYPAGTATYSITLTNVQNTYRWTAEVKTGGYSQITSSCVIATTVSGLFTDTNSWGDPVVACSGGYPSLTNASWPGGASDFTVTYLMNRQ